MVRWRTRTKGTSRQRGQHFPIAEKGSKVDLPRNMRVVTRSAKRDNLREIEEHEEAMDEQREELKKTDEELSKEAVDQQSIIEVIKQRNKAEIAKLQAKIDERKRKRLINEILEEIKERERAGELYDEEVKLTEEW